MSNAGIKRIPEIIAERLGDSADVIENVADSSGTEGYSQSVACIVKAKNKDAVSALVSLANELAGCTANAFSIHPISSGQNWGYGSATPNKSDKAIVLLSLIQLNKITYLDPDSGLCTLEPGVTQQQLYDYLNENHLPFMVPVTGAGPTCSILSNALERGYGITPIADHFSAITQMEGVLPTGDYYTSSIAAMDQSQNKFVDKAFKWKQGPYLDGIFTQSGNMIVTQATLCLARQPEGFDSFYLRFYGDTGFRRAHACIQKLFRQLGGVVGGINLMDKTRMMAMLADNPQGKGVHKVMTDQQKAALSSAHDIPDWTVVGTLYGSKSIVKAAAKEVKVLTNGLADKCLRSHSTRVSLARRVCKVAPKRAFLQLKQQLDSLSAATDIMRGKPSEVALSLSYWRNPHTAADASAHLNPARDRCGLLWYAPLIPANLSAMEAFVEMVRDITPRYNIEPLITFTHTSAHNIDSTVPILFDLSNPTAVDDAHNCLAALFEQGIKRGYVPYRLNIRQQEALDKNAVCWQTAGKIAHALDPNGVLSPHRYNPSRVANTRG